jgi:hypothetical protein
VTLSGHDADPGPRAHEFHRRAICSLFRDSALAAIAAHRVLSALDTTTQVESQPGVGAGVSNSNSASGHAYRVSREILRVMEDGESASDSDSYVTSGETRDTTVVYPSDYHDESRVGTCVLSTVRVGGVDATDDELCSQIEDHILLAVAEAGAIQHRPQDLQNRVFDRLDECGLHSYAGTVQAALCEWHGPAQKLFAANLTTATDEGEIEG